MACVRPDEAADAAALHRPLADGVEKLVDQVQDVPELHAWRHRSELQAAPAAASGALAPYTRDAVQFAERSFAAPEAAEAMAVSWPEAQTGRSPKLPAEQRLLPRALD